ncbi:GNAT family N-acetyltransferase [Aeromicrobium ponti]|uniref:Ribosomal protein S18 acetylase RimI-like enzyme n=1 Tax=Cytobacillus oceanisediminis TaxID=665099 RepID=A0A562K2A5_9BACI|nr:GNAT family N-acetyltransferase [Cytobacillus oceanisediminis]TWH89345.1 ribosomal protein S18 acetylase RimI-like enzyme [Cytobacillus oceanisediminis]
MLANKQLEDIRSLQQICEEKENIELKLNWDSLRNRPDGQQNDLFQYDDNGKLLGYLALYTFGGPMELCGMVHPEYRQKGIFSQLFKQARPSLEKASKLLINAPANSTSAKSFLISRPCTYSFSEYQMKRQASKIIAEVNPQVTLRNAIESDLKFLSYLDSVCFNIPEQEAIAFNKEVWLGGNEPTFIVEYGGKEAGKIRIQKEENATWIYGFAIEPSLQGNGIGRSALSQVVMNEQNKGIERVHLEVAAENEHALGLYKSCGFEPYGTQDYYEYDLNKL